ncbi:MAG TPA: nitroreductase family protein [Treponemataceae bacterium]|nr:nitroreductase family protein [Treponemataceae bacterium]
MKNSFFDVVENRRSIYKIGKNSKVPFFKIEKVLEKAILHTPSAFNSQSGRVVLLMNEHSSLFWKMVKESLELIVPKEAFEETEKKIKAFDSGIGTVLFFEDQTVVSGLMKDFELYKDHFPLWSLQSNGMLQFVVWSGLESLGLGASLQHYNPLIDLQVSKEWSIPISWKLLAQMPFGSIESPPDEKTFSSLEKRFFKYI